MTPMTVPSSPMKGALLPSVPRSVIPRSSSRRRLVISPSIAAASASGPPCAQRSDARSTSASMVGLAWSSACALSRSPSSSSSAELVAELLAAAAALAEEEPALDHRADRRDRQREQQVHDPRAAEHRDLEQVFDDHGAAPSFEPAQSKVFSATKRPGDAPPVASFASSSPLRVNVAWRLPSRPGLVDGEGEADGRLPARRRTGRRRSS